MRNLFIHLITAALLTTAASSASAQGIAENNAKRVAAAAPTKEQQKQQKALEKQARKEAKEEAKFMKADGWKPAPGTLNLVEQLTRYNLVKMQKTAYNIPIRYCAKSTAVARTFGMARKHATARCKAEIAQSISTQVAGLTSLAEKNVELTEDEAKFLEQAKEHYDQDLGRTDYYVEAVREKDGNTEAYIAIAADVPKRMTSIVNKVVEKKPDTAEQIADFFDQQ